MIPKPHQNPENIPASSKLKSVRWRAVFVIVVSLFLFSGVSVTAYAFYASSHILPHTDISGVSVGGITKQQALERLQAKEKTFLAKQLDLHYQNKKWALPVSELAPVFQYDAAVQTAYARGKTGSVSQQIRSFVSSLIFTHYETVDLAPLTEGVKKNLSTKFLSSIETQPAETSLSLIPGKVEIVPGKAGQKLDYSTFEASLHKAFVENTNAIDLRLQTFQPEVSINQATEARDLAQKILTNSWKLQAGTITTTLEPAEIADLIAVEIAKSQNGVVTGLRLNLKPDVLKNKVVNFAKKAEIKAVNARLKQDGGTLKADIPEKSGQSVEIDPTILLVKEQVLKGGDDHTLVAKTIVVQADLRADTIANLGLKELIGTATTDFAGSPNNRKFNIDRGQQSLNGGLVKSGQVYSTTATLGPVEESTGYLPELVIKENRTIPEAGGGLCQVSTTLFRAVLNAGLPIVERSNHSYRVGYYERETGPGLDATVYIPNPDFKWKNDTGSAVYIQSYITGTKITFELYGTKDGRTSTISKPQILEEIPVGDPIKVETDTLFKGETKQIETPHAGARTTVTYVVSRDGKEVNKQIFNSNYRPWPAQFLVGTKERPA